MRAQEQHAVQDRQNKAVWGASRVLNAYGDAEGFTDRGEAVIYEALREQLNDQPILDLGVGGGRTIPLLAALTSRYVAVDYSSAMVERCRRRYPHVDVRVADARDLHDFADESFGLVVFSFNGIDAVDREGRARVLAEVWRVLMRGGLFWFSTLNLAGIGLKLRPWRLEWPERRSSTLRYVSDAARMLALTPKRLLNYARLRPYFRHGHGWSIDTLSAHDYRLLVHYTSLSHELRELAALGFAPRLVVDSGEGKRLAADESDTFWFQILARKINQACTK